MQKPSLVISAYFAQIYLRVSRAKIVCRTLLDGQECLPQIFETNSEIWNLKYKIWNKKPVTCQLFINYWNHFFLHISIYWAFILVHIFFHVFNVTIFDYLTNFMLPEKLCFHSQKKKFVCSFRKDNMKNVEASCFFFRLTK